MNLVGDLLNKYKCCVVNDFSSIVVLVKFYFVYVFMHVYICSVGYTMYGISKCVCVLCL